ncbi:MAG: ATP-binding cassette domain-containing protein [Pseudomonadales bacterium]|nr:ATP-binding cassette domain-containing protein [Pseudomonadales bacterium]
MTSVSSDIPVSRFSLKRFSGLKAAVVFLKPYRLAIVAALASLIFTAGITLSLGQGIRLLIDNGFSSQTPEMLNQSVLIFCALILLLAVGTYVRFYSVSWLGERVVTDIRKSVFDHVVDLHPGFFEVNLASEIQSRLTTDTTLLQTVIGSSVSIALRSILMFIGGTIWLVITNPKLSAIVMMSVPLVVLPIIIFGRRVRRLSRESQDKVANVGAYVSETLTGIKTVQAFNHQERDKDIFGAHAESAFDVAKIRVAQRAMLITVVIVLVMGAVAVMFWVGGHDVMAGRITGGELAAFVFYAIIMGSSIGHISEVVGELQRAAGAMERIVELLNSENLIAAPESKPEAKPEQIEVNFDLMESAIEFKHVSFSYPTRKDVKVISELSLKVKAGETLALVGPSGAGKSTMFDLLLRFFDVSEGDIEVAGFPVRELDPIVLRDFFALVPQQPMLFHASIASNINYGVVDSSMEQVMEAAKAAYAHDFICELPDGYDTVLGDGGSGLSGGQKQRIAIARAVLKKPKILLLDEATSALDAESEYMVQKALESLMGQCTTIVIAHRLATVKNANRIAVMNHGKLMALGSHAELMETSDLYTRLAELQFSHPGFEWA